MINQRVREWRDVDLAIFQHEIFPKNEPAVLKALLRDWPAVQAGLKSNRALCDYIEKFDAGRPVETLLGNPSIAGRFYCCMDFSRCGTCLPVNAPHGERFSITMCFKAIR